MRLHRPWFVVNHILLYYSGILFGRGAAGNALMEWAGEGFAKGYLARWGGSGRSVEMWRSP